MTEDSRYPDTKVSYISFPHSDDSLEGEFVGIEDTPQYSFSDPLQREALSGPSSTGEEELIKFRRDRPKLVSKSAPKGNSSSYYNLPSDAVNIQDLIEHKSMDWSIANIFKACYRLDSKKGTSIEYDLNKLVYFSLRALGQSKGTKDYLKLAEGVMGSQSIKGTK